MTRHSLIESEIGKNCSNNLFFFYSIAATYLLPACLITFKEAIINHAIMRWLDLHLPRQSWWSMKGHAAADDDRNAVARANEDEDEDEG